MSLSSLPDDMIKKILGLLLDRDTWRQENYMNLALTCKRFYYIAVRQFNSIKRLDPKTKELFALNTFLVKKGTPQLKRYQQGPNRCQLHSDGWFGICFEQGLSEALLNRTSDITALAIQNYDLVNNLCLVSIESSRLDKIVELVLINCSLTHSNFNTLVSKLKNLVSLYLDESVRWNEDSDKTTLTKSLDYLNTPGRLLLETSQHWIHAKVLVFNDPFLEDVRWGPFEICRSLIIYLIRNQHKIKLIRFVQMSSEFWSYMMEICDIKDMKSEILHDTDKGELCRNIRYGSEYPGRVGKRSLSFWPTFPSNIRMDQLKSRSMKDELKTLAIEISRSIDPIR